MAGLEAGAPGTAQEIGLINRWKTGRARGWPAALAGVRRVGVPAAAIEQASRNEKL